MEKGSEKQGKTIYLSYMTFAQWVHCISMHQVGSARDTPIGVRMAGCLCKDDGDDPVVKA